MFCAEQVQWYALHMSKVAAGDADPDLDNRQW
jgi:phage terminase Nu1 subunit (DNA packaging protein)